MTIEILDVSQWEGKGPLLSKYNSISSKTRDGYWDAFRRKTYRREIVWVSDESNSWWYDDCET